MKAIPLTKGMSALVDECDAELISRHKWFATEKVPGRFYAAAAIPRCAGSCQKQILMHRLIMDAPKGLVVDHINNDPLDNRRCNLRVCSQGDNLHNRKLGKNSTSGHKGVYLGKSKRWRALITINGRLVTLGTFTDYGAAVAAWLEAATKDRGEFLRVR